MADELTTGAAAGGAGTTTENTGAADAAPSFDSTAWLDVTLDETAQPALSDDVFLGDEDLTQLPEPYRERIGQLNSGARSLREQYEVTTQRLTELGDVDALRRNATFGERWMATKKVPDPQGRVGADGRPVEVEARDWTGLLDHLYEQDEQGYNEFIETVAREHGGYIFQRVFGLDPSRMAEYRAADFAAPGYHDVPQAELALVDGKYHDVFRTLDQATRDSLIGMPPQARAGALAGLQAEHQARLASQGAQRADPQAIAEQVRQESWQQFEAANSQFVAEYNQSYEGLLGAAISVAEQVKFGDERDGIARFAAAGAVSEYFRSNPKGVELSKQAEESLRMMHVTRAQGNRALAASHEAQYKAHLLAGQRLAKAIALKVTTSMNPMLVGYKPAQVTADPSPFQKRDVMAAGGNANPGPSGPPPSLNDPNYIAQMAAQVDARLRRG